MSATEDAVATNQAPPSPAPSNDAAAGPANGDAAAPAAGTEAGPNGNNSTEAPKSSRTSARAKAASSSAPVSKKADREEKPKSEKPKPRASTSGGAAAPSKKAAGGSKGDSEKGFNVGDIVLARLKGYPPWREYELSLLNHAAGREWRDTEREMSILGRSHRLGIPTTWTARKWGFASRRSLSGLLLVSKAS